MNRMKFTETCRPKADEDVVIICQTNGSIFCGVLGYDKNNRTGEDCIYISMFVNDVETSATVDIENIRWWQRFPLTKTELYTGNAEI